MKSKEILFPGLAVYSNLDISDQLIKDIEEYAGINNKTWEHPRQNPKKYNMLQIAFPSADKGSDINSAKINGQLQVIQDCLENYCATYEVSYNPAESTHWNILKYDVGHKFTRHHDDDGDFKSRISLVFYLNDDYEGGELFFHHLNLKIKPQANDLVIFPSSYLFSHSTKPVISGTRYSITRFLS